MTTIILFQFILPDWSGSVIGAIAAVTGAAIGVVGTGLFNRVRAKTGSLKDATDSWSSMAALLKVTMQDLLQALETIKKLEVDIHLLTKKTAEAEAMAAEQNAIVTECRTEAAIIIESISHLTFVSTSPPTAEDDSVIRRLKEIRESAKRMVDIDKDNL